MATRRQSLTPEGPTSILNKRRSSVGETTAVVTTPAVRRFSTVTPRRRVSAAGSMLTTEGTVRGVRGSLTTVLSTAPVQNDTVAAVRYVEDAQELRKLAKISEAEEALREAIRADPTCVAAWANLGNMLCDYRQDFDGAERAYRAALAIDSTKAAVWFNLGHLMREQQKNMVEAKKAFQKALECDKTHGQSWTNLGLVLQAERNLSAAEDAHKSALMYSPKLAVAWYNLGRMLVGKRDADGRAALQRCLEINPNFSHATEIRARLDNTVPGGEARTLKSIV
eukprot:m.45798 g.45798  ORF g.45798 m.45798 type:complete len:281 (+) comp8683_c0_seq2:299-1141(+)